MFILGKSGRIVAHAPGTETLPPPFVSDTATWNGKEWEYFDKVEPFPALDSKDCLTAYDVLCHIVDLVSPEPGSYRKPKTKDYSILIPAYGKKEYVKGAIESCLSQTVQPKEVIVLDMDDEVECESPIVRVVKHERLNASAARNLLVEMCPTEQFIFLDADDKLEENFAEAVLSLPQNIVGTSVKHMEKNGHVQEQGQFVGWEERPFTMVNYNLTGLLCKEAFNGLGGLDEELAKGGEDSDFGLRLFAQKKWDVAFTTKTHLLYRINIGGLSTKRDFIKSKEVELHKHAKQLMEWLSLEDEPRKQAKEWVLKWRGPAKKVLEGFEAIWQYRTDEVMLVPVSLKEPKQIAACSSYLKWSKLAEPLLKESMRRPTTSVCSLPSPRYFGRAVDLIVDSCPTQFVDESKVLWNCGLDLSLPSLELMEKHNVVWTKSPSECLDGFDFRGNGEERMFSGREAALF